MYLEHKKKKTRDLIVFPLISGKNPELHLIFAAPHKALRSLNFGPLRHCNAVIRLFAALTTMGGLLAWRQQITSRKRDERESFPNFPPPASLCQQAASRHSCLMNANLCWKIWEGRILSSCFFAERWPVLLPPKKDIAAAGASVIY